MYFGFAVLALLSLKTVCVLEVFWLADCRVPGDSGNVVGGNVLSRIVAI